MPELLSRLELIQSAHKWSDEEMATRIGVSRPMWSMAKSGGTRLGPKALGAVIRSFPELKDEVLTYLSGPEPAPVTAEPQAA